MRDGVRMDEPAGRWILLATVLGSGVAALDATVVNLALPAISDDLGADVAGLQWVLNGYLLTLASFILLGGSLGDRFGRKRIFVLGLVWFAVASALCGLAGTTEVLVGARLLQGIGGALLTPGSLAIIQASFEPTDRGRAIGAWSALGGIATALGPFVGGWLIDVASWRWVFLLNLPVVAVAVAVAVRHVPETFDPEATHSIDVIGAVLGAVALAGITYGIIERHTPVGVAGAVAGIGFVVAERRMRDPMLDLGIFANRQFTGANLATLAIYAAIGGGFFLIAVQLQTTVGWSPLAAGAATFPVTFLMLLLSAKAGALSSRIGPRLPMSLGPIITAAGLALLAPVDEGASYVVDVLPPMIVFGLGLSLTVAPLTTTVLAAVEDRHAGIASGVNNAVARVAGLLAVAAIPVVVGIRRPEDFADGFPEAILITAALAAVGGVLAFLTIQNPPTPTRQADPGAHCAVDGPTLRVPEGTRV